MAEIERKIQKVFGGNLSPSGNIAVYGSKLAGAVAYSDNLDTIQNSSWLMGLLGAISPNKAPYVQDLNAIFYVFSKQLAYIFQAGVPEWNSQTEYFALKSIVRYNGQVYIAVANSTNQTPTNTSYWMKYGSDEFNQAYATLTGGYAINTVLRFGNYKIKSLVNNNIYAPSYDNIRISNSETGTFYWVLVDDIAPGTVIPYAGNKIPIGWLSCNGGEISRTTYPFLFRMIGTIYGAGDGNSTFKVPDFRNKTFWGGTTANVGTNKQAGIPDITGKIDGELDKYHTGAFYFIARHGSEGNSGEAAINEYGFAASRGEVHNGVYRNDVYGKSDTVQPPAIQVPFIIKY